MAPLVDQIQVAKANTQRYEEEINQIQQRIGNVRNQKNNMLKEVR